MRSLSSRSRTASISDSNFAISASRSSSASRSDASRSLASRWSAWACSSAAVRPDGRLGVRCGSTRHRGLRAREANVVGCFSFHMPFLSMFHGSVRTADTRTGNESPKWSRSSPAPGRTTDTRSPSARRRSARLGAPQMLVGGVVPQVGGDVGVHPAPATTSRNESPEPPHTATVTPRWRPRPPPAPPTTCRAARRARERRSRQRLRLGDIPMRPSPTSAGTGASSKTSKPAPRTGGRCASRRAPYRAAEPGRSPPRDPRHPFDGSDAADRRVTRPRAGGTGRCR